MNDCFIVGVRDVAEYSSDVRKSVGIEILMELHIVAEQALEGFALATATPLSSVVEFKRDSCFAHPDEWSGANIIFLPITLFTEDDVVKIENEFLPLLSSGTILLCTTRRLTSPRLSAFGPDYHLKLHKGSVSVHKYVVLEE